MSPMSPRLLRPRAAGGFNPKSIANLAAWWDASDASTITTVSGAVSQWNDKSGNGVNATQGTANNRPVTTSQTLNGRAVVTFDGSNDFLSFTGTARTNETWFIVARANLSASGTVKTNGLLTDSSSGHGVTPIIKNDGGQSQVEMALGGFTVGATRTAYNLGINATFGPALTTVIRSSAAGGVLRENGTQRATCTASNSATMSRIGGLSSSTFNLDGYIAELLIYSRALSTTEAQRVERWLGSKWGLTVA